MTMRRGEMCGGELAPRPQSVAATVASTVTRRAGPDADAESIVLTALAEWAQPPGPSWESSDQSAFWAAQFSLLTKDTQSKAVLSSPVCWSEYRASFGHGQQVFAASARVPHPGEEEKLMP